MIRSVFAIFALYCSAALSTFAGDVHPQDGPHVDVRIKVLSNMVIIRLEMNLVFLDYALDFPREFEDRVSGMEFEELEGLLADFFSEKHHVLIDGIRVRPSLERLRINDPDLSLLPLFPVSGEKGLRKIRFDLEYPVKQPPTFIDFEWETFPPDILTDAEDPPPLSIAAEIEAEGTRKPLVFSVAEPTFVWYAMGEDGGVRLLAVPESLAREVVKIPVGPLALVLVGVVLLLVGVLMARSKNKRSPLLVVTGVDAVLLIAALVMAFRGVGNIQFESKNSLPKAEQAEAIFRPLHANIYRAFDYVDESDIYDALAQSASGDFLDSLYRTIYSGLIMEEEDGAVARIAKVIPLNIEVESIGRSEQGEPTFAVRCLWRVDGVVSHWGHAHARSNEYQARWFVRDGDEGWRISGADILRQDRVDGEKDDTLHEEEEFDL